MWRNLKPRVLLGACPAGPATLANSLALQQRVKPSVTVQPGRSLLRVFPRVLLVAARKAQSPAAGAGGNEGWSARAVEYCSAVKGRVGRDTL